MPCTFSLNHPLHHWEKANYVEYIFWEANWSKTGTLSDPSWLRWLLCCLSELLVIIVQLAKSCIDEALNERWQGTFGCLLKTGSVVLRYWNHSYDNPPTVLIAIAVLPWSHHFCLLQYQFRLRSQRNWQCTLGV